MVRAVPGTSGVTRGLLSPGSAIARAVGEGPRGRGTGGEGVPREPGNPRGAGPCPRTSGVLATRTYCGEFHLAPRLPAQPVLAGQRADRGAGHWAARGAGVRGGTHRSTYAWPGLVDPGIRGDRPRRAAPHRTRGHRRARVRPGPARWRGTWPG